MVRYEETGKHLVSKLKFLAAEKPLMYLGHFQRYREEGTHMFTSVLFMNYVRHESIWHRHTRRKTQETIIPRVPRPRNSNCLSFPLPPCVL